MSELKIDWATVLPKIAEGAGIKLIRWTGASGLRHERRSSDDENTYWNPLLSRDDSMELLFRFNLGIQFNFQSIIVSRPVEGYPSTSVLVLAKPSTDYESDFDATVTEAVARILNLLED